MEVSQTTRPRPAAPTAVAGLAVLFEYRRHEREVVLGLKHNRGVSAVPDLADRLAQAVRRENWAMGATVVTWVPTTAARRRERGYDQSRLLAKAVARRLGLPCRHLLHRRGHAQEGLDAAARRAGPQLASRRSVTSPVLVIDDVVTTGATLAAAAAALRSAGAPAVYAAALAVSPPPSYG